MVKWQRNDCRCNSTCGPPLLPVLAHMSTTLTKTLKVRVKDKHIPLLQRMASEVNFVWNYCNQAKQDIYRKHRRHLTGFDLNKLCAGSSTAFELIGDSTIQGRSGIRQQTTQVR